ncbi:hypothetical protein SCP_0208080 [Sparassis crispa]|uniref:Uncharacterized protein n=1 Tax=Sparassis crispa TaxID=139825 RepID=A0A401GBQ5_9APHY|nr:hypothetical protein SCP_0208080 [Sparassis crispa]GBE79608.1 hypothetical protein SCP_0208080 [Sparassis crispa]
MAHTLSNVPGPAPLPAPLAEQVPPAMLLLAEYFMDVDNEDVSYVDGKNTSDPVMEAYMDDDSGYVDYDGNAIAFSAGTTNVLAHDMHHLEQQLENLQNGEDVHLRLGDMVSVMAEGEEHGETDAIVPDIIAAMRSMGIEDSDNEDDIEDMFCKEVPMRMDGDWKPYGSKTMFMLDLLDNLPRLRLLDDHMKTFIWIMKECGTPNVPSFSALRKKQAELAHEVNVETKQHESSQSNLFYANVPSATVKLDFANPLVWPHIQVYPEVGCSVSEFYHGEKWQYIKEDELDLNQLMWADWINTPHRHFYIKELAEVRDGRLVIPLRWVVDNKIECFDGYVVQYNSMCDLFEIQDKDLIRLQATELSANYFDLKTRGCSFKFPGLNVLLIISGQF